MNDLDSIINEGYVAKDYSYEARERARAKYSKKAEDLAHCEKCFCSEKHHVIVTIPDGIQDPRLADYSYLCGNCLKELGF